jgi:hypothetical protein
MQGVYRVWAEGRTLIETFVAAPGPMGWRYFGRLADEATGAEVMLVDHVVDQDWKLVRFRMEDRSGWRAVVTPAGEGLDVWSEREGNESLGRIAGAEAVWSVSPSSLLVAERRLWATGVSEVMMVAVGESADVATVAVTLRRSGRERVSTPGGSQDVDMLEVMVGDRRMRALVRSDLPLSCEGWFELES